MQINHFGIKLKGSEMNNHINETNFSILTDSVLFKYPTYKISYSWRQVENMLIYDLNMKYFKSLNKKEFENHLINFVNKNNFCEIYNLNDVMQTTGIYIMVLDDYKQAYIGQSKKIGKRIKEHWSNQLEFYKINQGCSPYKSKIVIDSFRALDTTRIFIKECVEKELNEFEEKYIDEFDNIYLCNVISPFMAKKDISLGQLYRYFPETKYDRLVIKSFEKYLYFDRKNLAIEVHEITHAHRIAVYLEAEMANDETFINYNVDIEYNRCINDIKRINNDNIKPDIIIHKRGKNDAAANLIVIEIKKEKFDEHDRRKIEGLCNDVKFNYKYGYCLLLNGEIERYSQNEKWVKIKGNCDNQ